MSHRLLATLLVLPLFAGCGAGATTGPSQSTDDGPTGDYLSDELPDPFEEGDSLRATFRDGEISFQASCNTMSGTAQLEDHVLVVSSVGATEMGCPGAGHEQDEWLVDFFTSRPAIDLLDVGFELTHHDGITLRFRAPNAASGDDVRLESLKSLKSMVWRLRGIQ